MWVVSRPRAKQELAQQARQGSWGARRSKKSPNAPGTLDLQNALNPPGEIRIERFGWTFCPGDKVMQVENDYDRDVYNGDLGVALYDGETSIFPRPPRG
jgi:hypothetical protein